MSSSVSSATTTMFHQRDTVPRSDTVSGFHADHFGNVNPTPRTGTGPLIRQRSLLSSLLMTNKHNRPADGQQSSQEAVASISDIDAMDSDSEEHDHPDQQIDDEEHGLTFTSAEPIHIVVDR